MTDSWKAGLPPVTLPFVALCGLFVALLIDRRLVVEISLADFVVITLCIAGWTAWMSGRAIAATWRPHWHVLASMIPFALVVRWVHFALFEGTLLSLHYYAVDLVVVLSFASLGYRFVRRRQMITQYRWLYEPAGPFEWRRTAPKS